MEEAFAYTEEETMCLEVMFAVGAAYFLDTVEDNSND